MSIVEYDFTKFTDKDMFGMRLAGTIPDFGYISSTKRRPFVEFCIKNGFISYYASTSDKRASIFNVHVTFRFSAMFNYGPKPVVMTDQNCVAIVYENFKMQNTGLNK